MNNQSGKTAIVALSVLVLLAGAGVGAYVLTKKDNDKVATSETSKDKGQSESEEHEEGETHPHSIAEMSKEGKASKCEFAYAGPNGTAQALMYTDGAGKSRIDMDSVTEQNNTGTMTQIVRDGKSYTIIESNGQKLGFSFETSAISSSGTTSSNQGISPNQSFDMTCDDWGVDPALFELPTEVQFLSTPTIPS